MRFAHCVTGHTCYVWCISKGDTQMTDQQKADAAFAAAHRAAERRADAEALAQYQRDCLASWAGK
jgi:GH24 family phage-related lysozyme (muramidase)